MRLFEPLLVALSTYSAIPVPQFQWTEKNMKYAICFFPVVGAVCGAALWAWFTLGHFLQVSSLFFAAAATSIPLLITGGIHMDGFMDTVDALASHQTQERKLEILKDPHCGAFAVAYCGIYLLLYTGLIHELFEADCITVLCPTFVLSRSLSALCAVALPKARRSGMLYAYTAEATGYIPTLVLSLTSFLSGCAAILLSPLPGSLAVLSSLISVLLYRHIAMRQFGGVTGDTAGFFLQSCELACLAGSWIGVQVL